MRQPSARESSRFDGGAAPAARHARGLPSAELLGADDVVRKGREQARQPGQVRARGLRLRMGARGGGQAAQGPVLGGCAVPAVDVHQQVVVGLGAATGFARRRRAGGQHGQQGRTSGRRTIGSV